MALASRRLLLEADSVARASASITVVNTASQLQAAIVAKAQDIELRSHVDISALGLVRGSNASFVPIALGAVEGTRSIRVCFPSSPCKQRRIASHMRPRWSLYRCMISSLLPRD